VTLRGLTLNVGPSNGITVSAVGTLTVENCFITGFASRGISMGSEGRLNVKGTDVKGCGYGIFISNSTGMVQASIDRCHLDGNTMHGFIATSTAPGGSTTAATHTTANLNVNCGWVCGAWFSSGKDVLNLESCTASENAGSGLAGYSGNGQSVARYSNCVFANNTAFGVNQTGSEVYQSRGNNTITGNGSGATNGTMGSFSPL
jgi:hypothetical protein